MPFRHPASLLAACFTFALATLASAAPLTVEDLVDLHGSGLTEEAFQELVMREGLLAPIGADAARELRDAGLPSDLVSWLITSDAPGPTSVEGVSLDFDEGVLVVSGEGEEASEEAALEPPRAVEPQAPAAPAPTIIIAMAAPSSQQPIVVPAYAAPWGWGSVAQIPARFGDPTSAFGTTIVSVGSTAGCGLVAPLEVPGCSRPQDRTVPVHTSRGIIYLPN